MAPGDINNEKIKLLAKHLRERIRIKDTLTDISHKLIVKPFITKYITAIEIKKMVINDSTININEKAILHLGSSKD